VAERPVQVSERDGGDKREQKGATPDQNREMLRELLKERFHLVMRLDQADKPVYELTTVDSGIKVQPDDGLGSSFTLTWGHLVVRHAKMGEVADVLSNFVDKPVVDRTSAKQAYGFTLDWTPDEFQQEQLATALGIVDQNTLAAPGDKLPPLGTAMREQLGVCPRKNFRLDKKDKAIQDN
jgi:uncharacterized protein (TIGR03435 family)